MPKGGKLTIRTGNIMFPDADQATPEGVSPGRYVVLSVGDTGVGMTPEVQERLFEPFFTTKEFGKGTGLGLATCYGIVKQSGGHIAVSTEPGRGSTFRIYLPRMEAVDAPPPTRRQPQVLPGGKETILLAEDELSLRHLATRILSSLGYNVLAAENGAEALRVVEQHREQNIELLLTDVVMPKLGGKELADQMQAKRPNVKVLFTSGWTGDAIVHDGILDKGVAFLPKPYTAELLARKVREVLDATA
jgi:CheY-like chemotaxis protein